MTDRPGSTDSPRGKRRLWATALGLAATGVAIAALASTVRQTEERQPKVDDDARLPVVTRTVSTVDGFILRRDYVGRVEARRDSAIGFELGGRLARVLVDEGDWVATGTVLAELDTERLRARRDGLVASRERAAAELALASATRQRVVEAQALDAVSSQALDEAELGLRSRRADLDVARVAIETLDVEIAKSQLRAPYEARVVERSADEGQVVDAGTPVLRLLERRRPEVRIGVAGDAITGLTEGQRQTLEVGGREIEATVRAVLPLRHRGTRTIDVLFELDAELGDGLRAGDLARLHLDQHVESTGFWLPTTALTESRRGLWAAFVVAASSATNTDTVTDTDGGDAVLERRDLEVLHQEADRVFVRGAIADGERVVVDGIHRLVPGLRVRTVDEVPR